MNIQSPDRLLALRRAGILDGEQAPGIDRLVRIAQRALGTPTVMFSAVGDSHQAFVSHVGLYEPWAQAGQTPLSHSLCAFVVEDERPFVVTDATADARIQNHPGVIEAAIAAYAGIPVRSPEGHVLGSLCAIDSAARLWDDEQLAVLRDVAESVETELLLRETSNALTDQLAGEHLLREFEQSMMSLAAATNDAWTIDDVVKSVIQHGRDSVGALLISFGLVDGNQLRFVHGDGVTATVAAEWVAVPLSAQVPMAGAIRSNEPITLSDPASFAAWPDFAQPAKELGLGSFVAVPIGNTHNSTRAVIGIGWADPLPSNELPDRVHRLASITSKGIDRAFSHERAREHARLLESLVLPASLPLVPHLDLSGMYLPPTRTQRVGGDVFDAVVRSDGKVALLLGDATGHDLRASKAATRLRHAVGMLSLEKRSPARVLGAVNQYLRRSDSNLLATACYAVVDPEAGTLAIANAGHPQPMLVRSSGAVEAVGPHGEPLLGHADFDYSEVVVSLAEADTFVMFSDGLIERRDRPMDVGEQWLQELLAAWTELSPHEMTDALRTLMPEERADDVAVLVARRGARQTLDNRDDLQLEYRAADTDLAHARAALGDWLAERVPEHAMCADIALVATELLTNARAASGDDDLVHLLAYRAADAVEIRVDNVGEWFAATTTMPQDSLPRGRGLPIASALSEVSVFAGDGTVSVTARFPQTTLPPR